MCAYKALDVADYVVHYCKTIGKSISNLKLQKILYFLEAHYLVNNSNIFEDEISKWRLGPVIESVYHEYKTFGSSVISYIPNRLTFNNGKITFTSFNVDAINEVDKKEIERIVDKYIDCDAFKLVQVTHEHDPWKNDEKYINAGHQGLKYNKAEIKDFFDDNPDAFEVS